MVVRLSRHDSGFVILDKQFMRDPKLSFKAKGLLATVLGFPEDWVVHMNHLAKLSRDRRDSVRSAIKELIKHGYMVKKFRRNNKGRFAEYDYVAFETKELGFSHIGKSGGRINYKEYLKSDRWKTIAKAVKKRDGACVECGSTSRLQAHHKTYKNIGNEGEHMGDLITLCKCCHDAAHGK